MAKRVAKKASKTGARRTTSGATVRTPRTANADRQGGARPVDPQEPELTRLRREENVALASGAIQPPPDRAPRIGRTSTQEPPPGRAHVDPNDPDSRPAPAADRIRVRATRLGYYQHVRRRPTDVFDLVPRIGMVDEPIMDPKTKEPKVDRDDRILTHRVKRLLTAEQQFSDRWMERVDDDTPEKVTTSGEVIKARHDEIVTAKFGHKATGDREVI